MISPLDPIRAERHCPVSITKSPRNPRRPHAVANHKVTPSIKHKNNTLAEDGTIDKRVIQLLMERRPWIQQI